MLNADPKRPHHHKPNNAKALIGAEELLQQSRGAFNPDSLFFGKPGKSPSKLANYVGAVHVTSLPGTVLLSVMPSCMLLAWLIPFESPDRGASHSASQVVEDASG